MKKQLLLCSALALAGCSSSPSTGDIEKFLEPKFANCQNIEVVDIKKINGYEDDGYYRVEYSYAVKLKNPKALKRMLEQWQEEKALDLQLKQEQADFYSAEEKLKQEIVALRKEFAQRIPNVNSNDFFNPRNIVSREESDAYQAAVDARKEQEDAFINEKVTELAALKNAWLERVKVKRNFGFLRNEPSATQAFYYKGCSREAVKFSRPIFDYPSTAAHQANDPSVCLLIHI